jgi:excisionase family DNA binding protein
MTDRPFSVATLAERWGCSRRHVSNLIRRGHLQSFRVGALLRVRPEEVERYECGTGSPSINEGSSALSITKTVHAEELRLRRLTSSRPQRKPPVSLVSCEPQNPSKG